MLVEVKQKSELMFSNVSRKVDVATGIYITDLNFQNTISQDHDYLALLNKKTLKPRNRDLEILSFNDFESSYIVCDTIMAIL